MEAILFEKPERSSFHFDLGLDNELFVKVGAEGTCNIECFLGVEGHVTQRDWHSVPMHQLRRLVFMKHHVSH